MKMHEIKKYKIFVTGILAILILSCFAGLFRIEFAKADTTLFTDDFTDLTAWTPYDEFSDTGELITWTFQSAPSSLAQGAGSNYDYQRNITGTYLPDNFNVSARYRFNSTNIDGNYVGSIKNLFELSDDGNTFITDASLRYNFDSQQLQIRLQNFTGNTGSDSEMLTSADFTGVIPYDSWPLLTISFTNSSQANGYVSVFIGTSLVGTMTDVRATNDDNHFNCLELYGYDFTWYVDDITVLEYTGPPPPPTPTPTATPTATPTPTPTPISSETIIFNASEGDFGNTGDNGLTLGNTYTVKALPITAGGSNHVLNVSLEWNATLVEPYNLYLTDLAVSNGNYTLPTLLAANLIEFVMHNGSTLVYQHLAGSSEYDGAGGHYIQISGGYLANITIINNVLTACSNTGVTAQYATRILDSGVKSVWLINTNAPTITDGTLALTFYSLTPTGGGGGGYSNPTPNPSGNGGGGGWSNFTGGIAEAISDFIAKIPPWAIWVLVGILIFVGVAGVLKGGKKRGGTPSRSFNNGGM